MKPMTVIQYLRQELSISGETATDFMRMWKELTDEDKLDLKAAATKEMVGDE